MTDFEIKIINFVRDFISPFIDKILEMITTLGEQTLLIALILIVYFIYSKKDGQRIAFAVFTSLLLNNAIKGIVKRVRPFNNPLSTFDPSRIETATGYAFPSGHTQNAAATYTALALTFNKRWLWVLSSIVIILVAISRVGLGVHYPTDVIAGIAFGVGFAFLADKLFRHVEDNFFKEMMLYLIVALAFLPFIFIFIRPTHLEMVYYKDLYTSYAFFLGYIGAIALERKFVNFDNSNPLKIRIIRTIIALVLVAVLTFGLKVIFPEDNIAFDMIRYFLISFIVIGVYPIVTRKCLFKKTEILLNFLIKYI